jgi:hypothetical protein
MDKETPITKDMKFDEFKQKSPHFLDSSNPHESAVFRVPQIPHSVRKYNVMMHWVNSNESRVQSREKNEPNLLGWGCFTIQCCIHVQQKLCLHRQEKKISRKHGAATKAFWV